MRGDAGALQVLTRAERFSLRNAARPIASWIATRADHARHQSFHDVKDAVTSSKSASATPLVTNRGAQWAIAEASRASVMGKVRPMKNINHQG